LPAPERFFLAAGAFWGVVLLLLTPPFMVADEFQHTFRAWDLSRGVLLPAVGEGGHLVARVPRSLRDMAAPLVTVPFHRDRKLDRSLTGAELRRALEPSDLVTVVVDDMRGKSPLVHAAPALGLLAGRVLRLPPIACLWLARAANLCLWLALVAVAIRTLPAGRWALTLVGLLPMSLAEAASTSADAVTNGVAWLFFASVVAGTVAGERARRRGDLAALTALAAVLAQCKQLYVLLVPLVALLPRARFASAGRYRAALAAPFAGAAASLGLLTGVLALHGAPPQAFAFAGAAPVEQLAHVAAAPLRFLRVLAASLAGFDWRSVVGSLGWNDAPLPAIAGAGGLALLFLVALLDGGAETAPTLRQRAIAAATAAAVVVAVATALYLVFTEVGAPLVNGLQGRYFLPALPPLLYALQPRGRPLGAALPALAAMTGGACLDLAAVVTVAARFYG